MMDVLLLALWVSYARLAATIPTKLEGGALCSVAAGLMSLFARAALDKAAVWNLIAPDREAPPVLPAVSCSGCELVLPARDAGRHCQRCDARVHPRLTDGLWRAAALTIGGAILYLPANIMTVMPSCSTHSSTEAASG